MDELDWTDDELREDLGVTVSGSQPEGTSAADPWAADVSDVAPWDVSVSAPRYLDRTRHILTISLVGLMAGLLILIACWAVDETPNTDADKVLIAAISSLTGVLGTAVGFYFSEQSRKSSGG